MAFVRTRGVGWVVGYYLCVLDQMSRDRDHAHAASSPSIVRILDLVRDATGTDFLQYRPAMVQRRIQNRMITVGATTVDEYMRYMTMRPEEAERLAERLTIKVSRFYRNAAVFDALRHDVLPRLVRQHRDAPLQVWVAGCGCGEELYTLAMLLEEGGHPGTIHGSDVDSGALAAATHGVYPSTALEELPDDLRERFLTRVEDRGGHRYKVVDALRTRVRLHRHDLTAPGPPPASGRTFSMVSCRNVLIYFGKPAQVRTLTRLRGALAPGGILVLGEAEWPAATVLASLEVVVQKARIFKAI